MRVVAIQRLQAQQLAGWIRQPAPSSFRQHKIYSRPDIARAIACAAARGEPPEMANGDKKVVQSFLLRVLVPRNSKPSGASWLIARAESLDALRAHRITRTGPPGRQDAGRCAFS